jgi:hypothetical protein
MIFDKDKRFIFVHNPRTGGTSIRKVLESYQDPHMHKELHNKIKNTIFEEIHGAVPEHAAVDIFSDHIRNQYKYIFTCVRNPFSRMYSYYQKMHQQDKEFRKMLSVGAPPARAVDVEYLQKYPTTTPQYAEIIENMYGLWSTMETRYSSLIIFPYAFWTFGTHEVVRFEDLQEPGEWEKLMHKCGIEDVPPRPHENRSYKDNLLEYRDAYTDNMRKKVQTMFQKEIETYGYEF